MFGYLLNTNNHRVQTADADWQINGLTLLYSFRD